MATLPVMEIERSNTYVEIVTRVSYLLPQTFNRRARHEPLRLGDLWQTALVQYLAPPELILYHSVENLHALLNGVQEYLERFSGLAIGFRVLDMSQGIPQDKEKASQRLYFIEERLELFWCLWETEKLVETIAGSGRSLYHSDTAGHDRQGIHLLGVGLSVQFA